MSDTIFDLLTRVRRFVDDVTEEVERQKSKKQPGEGQSDHDRDRDHGRDEHRSIFVSRERYMELLRSSNDLQSSVATQKQRLQAALDRFHHSNGGASPRTGSIPLDQVVDAVVKTLDGKLKPIKGGFPGHIEPDAERIIDGLRSQIRDLEAQQAADVRVIASQAREIEKLGADEATA